MLIYIPLFGVLCFSWYRFARRWPNAFVWTLLLYFALHVYWPSNQSGRYFAPLIPILLVCFWFGLESLGRWRLRMLEFLVVVHLAVALGNWAFIDRPYALSNVGYWAEVSTLAGTIGPDGGKVQVASELGSSQFMLAYVLDRPVDCKPSTTDPDLTVRWLVVPSEAPPVADFSDCLVAGPYRLLRRSGN